MRISRRHKSMSAIHEVNQNHVTLYEDQHHQFKDQQATNIVTTPSFNTALF